MVQFFLIWKHVSGKRQEEPLGGRLRYFWHEDIQTQITGRFRELSCFLAANQTLSISPFRELSLKKWHYVSFKIWQGKVLFFQSHFGHITCRLKKKKRFVSKVAFRFPLYFPFVFEEEKIPQAIFF